MEEFKIIYNDKLNSITRVPNRLVRTIAGYVVLLLFIKMALTIAYNKLYYLGQLTINEKTYNFLKIVIIVISLLIVLLIESFIGNKREHKAAMDEEMILHNNAVKLQRFIKEKAEIEIISTNLVRVKRKYRTSLIAVKEGIINLDSNIIDFTKEIGEELANKEF